jgi:hypothetical protein
MASLPESIRASSFLQRSPDLSLLSGGADRLRVIATVSDGLGNTGTRTHEIEVIDPLALVVAPEARPFKTGLPDIGDAWFAEGRGLYDIDGGLRTLLERPVDAIDYLGDRLVLIKSNQPTM